MPWNQVPRWSETATWDVVVWNRPVAVMLTDYGALPPEERNILRSIFLDPRARESSTIGKAWRGSFWAHSGSTRHALARRLRLNLWSTNFAG